MRFPVFSALFLVFGELGNVARFSLFFFFFFVKPNR